MTVVDPSPYAPLEPLLDALDRDATLGDPLELSARIRALDALEHWLPDPVSGSVPPAEPRLRRAWAWQERLQEINAGLFDAIRARVRLGHGRAAWQPALDACRSDADDGAMSDDGYDALDALVSGVLQMPEPAAPVVELDAEMVFYQPTPARHVLDLVERVAPEADDVLIDLGSGLGLVPILVSLWSRARCIGVELEPGFVASAESCARSLRVDRVTFSVADARAADLSQGTVFYLYTPFRGTILREVLDALRAQSATRAIRVCSYGPCSEVLAAEPWLQATGPFDAGRVMIFRPREPGRDAKGAEGMESS